MSNYDPVQQAWSAQLRAQGARGMSAGQYIDNLATASRPPYPVPDLVDTGRTAMSHGVGHYGAINQSNHQYLGGAPALNSYNAGQGPNTDGYVVRQTPGFLSRSEGMRGNISPRECPTEIVQDRARTAQGDAMPAVTLTTASAISIHHYPEPTSHHGCPYPIPQSCICGRWPAPVAQPSSPTHEHRCKRRRETDDIGDPDQGNEAYTSKRQKVKIQEPPCRIRTIGSTVSGPEHVGLSAIPRFKANFQVPTLGSHTTSSSKGMQRDAQLAEGPAPAKTQGKVEPSSKERQSIESVKSTQTRMKIPGCELTALEILVISPETFTNIDECMWRLKSNGWSSEVISKVVGHFTTTVSHEFLPEVIKSKVDNAAIAHGFKDMTEAETASPLQPISDYSTTSWDQDNKARADVQEVEARARAKKAKKGYKSVVRQSVSNEDIALDQLAGRLALVPTALDRGVFSQCITYAINNPTEKVHISDIPVLVQRQAFTMPAIGAGVNRDIESLERTKELLGV